MQRRSKLSKTRSWAVPSNNTVYIDENHPAQDNNNTRRDARASVPLGGRKSGFFAQLFSSAPSSSSAKPNPTSAGPSFVNLSRKSPSPSPSAAVPHSIPPNLSIQSLSPDLLNDPAFSPDPHSHPLFVTNPDSPPEALAPSKPFSNQGSHGDMTESPTQLSYASRYGSKYSSSDFMMGNASSAQLTDITDSSYTSSSSRSTDTAGKPPQKNLIILEPPRMQSPPPAYDDPGHSRPAAARHASVPALPVSQLQAIDVPPRPATTANDSDIADPRNPPRRNRGLDPIDELDETNPLGLSLHHGGPYEAIKLSQNPRQPQVKYNRHDQPIAHGTTTRKPINRQPYTADPTAFIPLGAPLNLTPGQILPRNFQPYTQPPPTAPQSQTQPNPYRQRSYPERPIQQEPHSRPPPQNQHRQIHTAESSMQSSYVLPPQARMQQQITHTAMAPQPSLLPPSQHLEDADAPSIYGDEEDAYGGIVDAYGAIEDETPQILAPDNAAPRQPEVEPSSHSRFASAQTPQTYSDSSAAIGGEDDPVARALYVVKRARTQRAQKPSKPFSGFAAFDEGPSAAGYQLPSAPDRREPSSSSSRNIPPLPPGAYQPPPRTYEQQGIPSEQSREPAPHVQHYAPAAPANHFDAAWHRRATSLDPSVDAYGAPRPRHRATDPSIDAYGAPPLRHRATDPGAQNSNLTQTSNRYIPPSLNPNTGVPRRSIESNSPSQPYPTGDLRDHEQRLNASAPSIQQTFTSANGWNGPLPRHIPSKLTMPQPLYNPNGAPPPPSRNAPPPEQPRSLFQPPQHGNNMTRPQIPPQNYPPRQQQRDSPAPTPEPPRVQAQAIPMAADSRKVLRKKSTAHHTNYVADDKPAAMVTLDRADWLAPSTNHPRSKSEMRPPLTAAVARVPLPPPPPMPMPQKDKKVPKRLSKKR